MEIAEEPKYLSPLPLSGSSTVGNPPNRDEQSDSNNESVQTVGAIFRVSKGVPLSSHLNSTTVRADDQDEGSARLNGLVSAGQRKRKAEEQSDEKQEAIRGSRRKLAAFLSENGFPLQKSAQNQ